MNYLLQQSEWLEKETASDRKDGERGTPVHSGGNVDCGGYLVNNREVP